MRFFIALIFFIILAAFSRLLGRLWSSLLCGLLFMGVIIYGNCFSETNTRFYCNRLEDKCSYLQSSSKGDNFKEYRSFKLSDVVDVKYEERMKKRTRRGITREYPRKEIFFLMTDGSKKVYPGSLMSDDTATNNQILYTIEQFLNSNDEEYNATTNKEDEPIRFDLWIIAFIIGCAVGFGVHRGFWGDN